MTPTTTAKNADTQDGDALSALTGVVSDFQTMQADALSSIRRHTKAVGEELARLQERPTREELTEVQADLKKCRADLDGSRADHRREVEELRGTLADRDAKISELNEAREADAAVIAGLKDRFRSFEVAAQSILAGMAIDTPVPAPAAPAVQDSPAAEETAPAAEPVAAPEPAQEPAPAPVEPQAEEVAQEPAQAAVEDPFGFDELPAPAAQEAPTPVGLVIPDLEDGDPFDSDPSRAALLAQAVGSDDPFDLGDAPVKAAAPAVQEAPAGQAGGVVNDPFAFMDLDAPAAPAVQEAPKIQPVYI